MAEALATQLDRVQTLIASIESDGVAGYTVGNQTFTKLDLPALYAREERLLRKIARGSDTGRRVAEV